MSYVDDMRRELELLVKHHRDVPLPPEEVTDFRTFRCAEPEVAKSIPPATIGPPTSRAPPCPGTPLTVLNSRSVS